MAVEQRGRFGADRFRSALVLIGRHSLDMFGRFQKSQENNPADDQTEAEDGEDVVEHDQSFRLAVLRASRQTRTPTLYLYMSNFCLIIFLW